MTGIRETIARIADKYGANDHEQRDRILHAFNIADQAHAGQGWIDIFQIKTGIIDSEPRSIIVSSCQRLIFLIMPEIEVHRESRILAASVEQRCDTVIEITSVFN